VTEADEREAFEVAAYDHYLAERAKRDIPGDFEVPTTREGLLWRHPNGSYGVLLYNAAWWAWQARAAIAQPRPRHYDDLTGLNCAECGKQQFMTPSGVTCPNGHGGAESL
jgi:hypothetical protein